MREGYTRGRRLRAGAPVGGGGAGPAAEGAVEAAEVGVAELEGDVDDRAGGVAEQRAGLLGADVVDEILVAGAERLEAALEGARRQREAAGDARELGAARGQLDGDRVAEPGDERRRRARGGEARELLLGVRLEVAPR